MLEAYAEGVNAGLAALGAKPFEYLVLRESPRAWLPEDTFLISFTMTRPPAFFGIKRWLMM